RSRTSALDRRTTLRAQVRGEAHTLEQLREARMLAHGLEHREPKPRHVEVPHLDVAAPQRVERGLDVAVRREPPADDELTHRIPVLGRLRRAAELFERETRHVEDRVDLLENRQRLRLRKIEITPHLRPENLVERRAARPKSMQHEML